jgi:hypothetical protein
VNQDVGLTNFFPDRCITVVALYTFPYAIV